MSEPNAIVERGVIVDGLRLATAMNDAPRTLYARAPLIILPGIGFVWQDYLPLLRHYASERRVFALDWPGFGGSARPGPQEYTYTDERLAETLSAWIDSLGIGRAVLVSTDISGRIAVRYASANPKRTLGVAMIAPIGVTSATISSSFTARLLRGTWLMRLLDSYVVSLLVGPASTVEAREVLERHRALRRAPKHTQAIAALTSLWGLLLQPSEGISQMAKTLHVPVMVLSGALDPLITEIEARNTAAMLGERGTLAVTLPESGHLPFLQQPERFYQALSGLLETAEMVALNPPT